MPEDNQLKILAEIRTLVETFGQQSQLVNNQLQTVLTTIKEIELRDEKRHQAFMEEMEAQKVAREAQTQLIQSLDQSVESLQEVTAAMINLVDQLTSNNQLQNAVG